MTPPVYNPATGLWRFTVNSPRLDGPQMVDMLLPDAMPDGERFRVLYVLPVEADDGVRYNHPLLELRRINAANQYGLICVYPMFNTVSWFGNRDPHMRHDEYLALELPALIDRAYPTVAGADGRLLLGFSKSGWGAFTLITRHPDVFGYAAGSDTPWLMDKRQFGAWGTAAHFGTVTNFAQYLPSRLLPQHAIVFATHTRLVLAGSSSFGLNMDPCVTYDGPPHTEGMHDVLQAAGIKHVYRNDLKTVHSWNTHWLQPVLAEMLALANDKEQHP